MTTQRIPIHSLASFLEFLGFAYERVILTYLRTCMIPDNEIFPIPELRKIATT